MKKLLLCLLIGIFCQEFSVFAQPSNDNCANTITLTMNALCTNGQTNTATSEGLDAGGCTSANSRTVWYKFYALLFAYILVDLCIKGKRLL